MKPENEKLNTSVDGGTLTPEVRKGRDLLDKCLEAHGGLDTWRQFEGLQYTVINNGTPVYQLTNLNDRRAYIKSDLFEVGFDGNMAWAYPDASKVSGGSAAFYYNLDFYFISIPFVLKDPGVLTTYEGLTEIGEKKYETLKVTFRNDVGFTPDDIYYLYLDPESFLLQILVYSVSFFETTESGVLNTAKIYSNYQDVQGLLMPGKMENLGWKNGVLGEGKNHIREFKNIRFLKTIPNPQLFSIKQGAATEKVD
ncbi:MAG: hypothetical protein IPL46_00975 [Saprospiraceae bacterium]|nr:hypothetical protein [Saprospiraceae bacterium]